MDPDEELNTIESNFLGLHSPTYMRSPTPDYSEDHKLESIWFADTPDVGRSSSPLENSLPPIIHNDLPEELDIYVDLPPLSSSPHDFKSESSPQSSGSRKSESEVTSSSLTSYCSDNCEPLPTSQRKEPVDDLCFAGHVDDFEQRLHQLLLNALKEREESGSFRRQNTVSATWSYSVTPELHVRRKTYSSSECDHDTNGNRLPKRCRSVTPDRVSLSPKPLSDSDDISPIRFEGGTKTPRISTYRIIKRAQSYQASIAGPSGKRQKTARDSGAHAHEQVYASRAASLRRGESLKSLATTNKRSPLTSIAECIPTVPNSPDKRNVDTRPIPYPVPIIAPPWDHTAKLPMSSETVAKTRLRALLQREAIGREEDGLFPGISECPPLWMYRESNSIYEEDETPEDSVKYDWEVVMGIGSGKRKAIIDWILTVLPPRQEKHTTKITLPSLTPSPDSSPCDYSSQSTSTSSDQSSTTEHNSNLHDQLQNSPETRFHAAWLFLRFFFLTMQPDHLPVDDMSSHICKALQKEGFNLIIWDIAVACLSLSVKFHRDFLEPLSPVYAQEYLSLTAHDMCRDDLESAHRDVLSAFDYKLGITPQPVMNELWLALPSLRELLDFEHAREKVIAGTWNYLFRCLREPDIQRFPISMLTAVCLWNISLDILSKESCHEMNAHDSEGVLCDIQALVGVTDLQWKECHLWIMCSVRSE